MGRRGFGKGAMRNELYRRYAERIRDLEVREAWADAAKTLAMLVVSGRRAAATRMANAVLAHRCTWESPSGISDAYRHAADTAYSKIQQKMKTENN